MRVKSFPEKLAKWECVDTQDPWLGGGNYLENPIFKPSGERKEDDVLLWD